jgi:hypothetical protein
MRIYNEINDILFVINDEFAVDFYLAESNPINKSKKSSKVRGRNNFPFDDDDMEKLVINETRNTYAFRMNRSNKYIGNY